MFTALGLDNSMWNYALTDFNFYVALRAWSKILESLTGFFFLPSGRENGGFVVCGCVCVSKFQWKFLVLPAWFNRIRTPSSAKSKMSNFWISSLHISKSVSLKAPPSTPGSPSMWTLVLAAGLKLGFRMLAISCFKAVSLLIFKIFGGIMLSLEILSSDKMLEIAFSLQNKHVIHKLSIIILFILNRWSFVDQVWEQANFTNIILYLFHYTRPQKIKNKFACPLLTFEIKSVIREIFFFFFFFKFCFSDTTIWKPGCVKAMQYSVTTNIHNRRIPGKALYGCRAVETMNYNDWETFHFNNFQQQNICKFRVKLKKKK